MWGPGAPFPGAAIVSRLDWIDPSGRAPKNFQFVKHATMLWKHHAEHQPSRSHTDVWINVWRVEFALNRRPATTLSNTWSRNPSPQNYVINHSSKVTEPKHLVPSHNHSADRTRANQFLFNRRQYAVQYSAGLRWGMETSVAQRQREKDSALTEGDRDAIWAQWQQGLIDQLAPNKVAVVRLFLECWEALLKVLDYDTIHNILGNKIRTLSCRRPQQRIPKETSPQYLGMIELFGWIHSPRTLSHASPTNWCSAAATSETAFFNLGSAGKRL
jgi:hypothetical protein